MFKYLTGIKPTGELHLGNYVSTIKPILPFKDETIFLIADLHALTTIQNKKILVKNRQEIIKILKSFDIHNIVIQSQIPEISELNTILSAYTSKGLLNRSHAYRSIKEDNEEKEKDSDKGVNSLLYTYPILMTADLVSFNTKYVTIGPDQVQHIEMANDIVNKFNHVNKTDILKVPEPMITHHSIPGYDGRKMSKSYNNIIPLFCSESKLKKHIFSIKTNDKRDGEPKHINESPITQLFELFSTNEELFGLKIDMKNGIGWKQVKERTFEKVNNDIKEGRNKYKELEGKEEYLENKCINFSRNNTRAYIQERVTDEVKHMIIGI